jgi:phospholipid/cholesterol/gamma-HCH transport system substrate-binding protein
MKITKEVRIGVIGIATLLVFILGLNFLKGRAFFGNNRSFYALYTDASGIVEGSFVKVHGVKIGTVTGIALSKKEPGKVEVSFNLTDKNIFIPKDSKAIIGSDGLFTKALIITPGAAKEALPEGSFISSAEEKDLLSKLSGNAEPILDTTKEVMTNVNGAVKNIDNTITNFNSLLDATTKANVKNAVVGLDKSVADFNILSASLAAQRQNIASTISSLQAFAANLNKNNSGINQTITNIEKTTKKLSDANLEGTINNMETTLASLKVTLNELNKTIAKVNNNDGSLGMLVNDKKLYNDLQKSVGSLDALLIDLKAHPNRYLSFSVFGKKDKGSATPENTNK